MGCGCNEDASARDCGDVTTLSVSSHTIQTREARNVKDKTVKDSCIAALCKLRHLMRMLECAGHLV